MKIYLVWSSEPSSHDFNEGMMDEIKFEQIPIISFEALAETMNTLHGTSNVFYSIRHMTRNEIEDMFPSNDASSPPSEPSPTL